ncbi:hypothetical protein WJ438_01135 [Streptomyces sp. GD-15H]
MALNRQLTPWIAKLFDLAVKLGGVSDAFVPALVQVADVRVDDVRPLQALGHDVVGGAGAHQFADGGLVQPELAADRRLRHPLFPQLVGGGVLLTQPGHDFQFPWWLDHRRLRLRLVGRAGRSRRRFGQAGAMGVHRLLDRLAEVGPQVIAVGNLLGLGRPGPRALPVTAGAVPADDLHLGVLAEPGGQVLALTAVEEMQRTVGGHVDQDRAVVASPAEGEVVHAQHFHGADIGLGQGPDQPQQRVPAPTDADRGRQAGSGPAGQGQADLRQHPAQQRGMAAVRGGQSHDLLGERHRRAGEILTAEAAYAQLDHDAEPAHGDVTQPAYVPAVHPGRALAAPADRGRRSRPRPQHHLVRPPLDLLDQQRGQVRKQLREHITRARDA